MGPQRVLQAAVALACVAAAHASAAPDKLHERLALIDLGGATRGSGFADASRALQAAIVAAGFEPVIGDGVEDALAGRDVDGDAVQLAAAVATAQRAFGELRCSDASTAARQAIGIAAARQAAGRAAPELVRAWTLVLLCADRESQPDAAHTAASRLRALGGSPDAASVLAKYPDVDAIADRELVELDVDTEVAGAAIWIDFRPVGASPLHVELAAGEHVIAAAAGNRRGWAAGTAVRTQKAIRVPLVETAGRWAELAHRVAGWNGALPPAGELAWVLGQIHARAALVRHGDTVEAWGQIGRSELPYRLGGSDGIGPVADVERVLGVVQERIRAWNDHAPDPDRPLLVEDRGGRGERRTDDGDKPTKWWVYAAIAGAVAIGATIIYVHDSASDRQRVELHFP